MDLFGFNLEFQSKIEAFGVDKSFYDIESSDLNHLWDSDLETGIGDALKVDDDWASSEGFLDVKPQVVLHDRLMSDAVLGGTGPIKSEHSYCTRIFSPDDDSSNDSNTDALRKLQHDMEDECYPIIPLKIEPDNDDDDDDDCNHRAGSPIIMIKEEPMSEGDSPPSSCPPSPSLTSMSYRIRAAEKRNAKAAKTLDIADYNKTMSLAGATRSIMFATRNTVLSQQPTRIVLPQLSAKIDTLSSAGFGLPPTPPSSTSSDSEAGNVSPERSSNSPTRRLFLSANSQSATRQPIQTPLISNQPKGSTGILLLTEEEKRTLLAEGYPIPTRLPLSKAEEKSLKKVRRKIKNKISAQESRRKKKEYMDALERKVDLLASQNTEYKKKISTLEENNSSLLSQLQKLQQLVGLQTLQSVNLAFKNTTTSRNNTK